jgi:hypothetical protein
VPRSWAGFHDLRGIVPERMFYYTWDMDEHDSLQPTHPVELQNFEYYLPGLSEADRLILVDLCERARQHQAAVRAFNHPLPYQVSLLALLLEELKAIRRLQQMVEYLLER